MDVHISNVHAEDMIMVTDWKKLVLSDLVLDKLFKHGFAKMERLKNIRFYNLA